MSKLNAEVEVKINWNLTDEQWELLRQLFKTNAFTVNEVRHIMGLDPIDGERGEKAYGIG